MKKMKKTLSVTLLMLGLVSIGAGAGFAANNAVEPVTAQAELYPDWTCAVSKISATDESTSSVIYAEVVEGDTVDELDEESLFTLHEDSGAGFTLNGEAFTPAKVVVPAENVIYIDLGFEAKEGDVVAVNGAFSNEDWEMTIEFDNCELTFDGSAWGEIGGSDTPDVPDVPDVPDTPDDGYTRYNLGALTFHVNSKPFGGAGKANNQLYLERVDGEALPFMSWDVLFTADTDGYFLINGEAKAPSEIKSTSDGFFWLFDALNAGDTVTVGGTFKCESQGIIYNIVESKFTWNGTNWEIYTPPIEYTTYTFNKLDGANGCAANVIYAYPVEGDTLPAGDWDNAFSFEADSGAGLKLNDVALDAWEIKQPGDFYITFGVSAVAGDKFTIDGTFYNKATAKKFVFNNCALVFDGTTWASEREEEPEQPNPDAPEVEYTTYNVNNLGIANGCTADVVYAYVTDGDELPGGDWDNAFSFEAGSGAGMKLNGAEISGWEIKQPGDFYIKLSTAAVAGDTLTIDGAYYNEATAKRFVFNNCTVTFNGTGWEAPSVEPEEPEQPDQPPVEGYTTCELGAVMKTADGNASSVYFVFEDGVTLPVNSWDYAFSYVDGNGITVDGVMINMENKVKSVGGKFFVDLSEAANVDSILKIGGTFVCESQQVKYVIEDSEFRWDGSAWVTTAEVTYTTYDLGVLTLHVNSTVGGAAGLNNQLYLTRLDEGELPVQSWDDFFTVDTDGYFLINGEAKAPSEIKSTGDGFFWLFDALNAGDTLTVGGTFKCESQAVKYTIAESKFTWNGTNWEVYTPPVEYTTYTFDKLDGANGCAANVIYAYPVEGDALPAGDWDNAFSFEADSGVGLKLNDVALDAWEIKQPGDFYIAFGVEATVGDKFTIDGTFYNKATAKKFVFNNCALTFNGTTWVGSLNFARAEAKTAIDNYLANFSESNYYEAQWAEITSIVDSAKANIDAALEADLDAIVMHAKGAIDQVETKEDMDVILVAVRNNAKMEVAGYKNEEDYKEEEWKTIEDAINAANAKIDAAKSETEIQAAVTEAKAAMDAVKTAAELDAEQLSAWREAAKAEVQAYYDAIDFTKYSTEDNAKLAGYVAEAMKAIAEETDKAKIDEAVAQFKANIDGVTGGEEKSGCGSVGVASGCLLGGIAMVAAAVTLRKKKED